MCSLELDSYGAWVRASAAVQAAGGVAGWFLMLVFGVCAIYDLMQFYRVARCLFA